MNATSQMFIDLDNPAPLDKLEWISKGKVYPILDPPQEVVVYRNSHLDIQNLPVQIFEHMHGLHFHAKSQGQALYISKFGLLSLSQFLCTLTHSPTATNDGGMIAITQQDHKLFKILTLH